MVNFGYAESSRTAWAAQDPVSKKNPQKAHKKNVLIFSVFCHQLVALHLVSFL